MAAEDGQDRTLPPTPKRISEARQKGQVPRSRELNTTLLLLAASASILLFGGWMMERLQAVIEHGLTIDPRSLQDPNLPLRALSQAAVDAALTFSPFVLVLLVASFVGPLLMGGWNVSTEALGFNPTRLNPLKGVGKLFSWNGLVELAKAAAKFVLVAGAAVLILWYMAPRILGLGDEPLEQAMAHAGWIMAWTFLLLSAVTIVIAAIDAPFQMWFYKRQLRMTRKEVQDEAKDAEGQPEVKRRIRRAQMELAQRRMMAAVPKADVIITNPTHYAVALAYDDDRMRAPRVVAKGADLVAAQIRTLGRDAGVPLVEAPRLARAIFYTVELEQEIPAGLYLAVAQVLAYVYQLRGARYGMEPVPPAPTNLPVPDEFLAREQRGVKPMT